MRIALVLMLCAAFLVGITCPVQASDETVIVVSFAGDVKVIPFGAIKPVTCQPDMVLKEGTRIITGEESNIEIAFDRSRNNIVKIKANSEVVIKLDGEDKIELIEGKTLTLLRDLRKGQIFRVRTPCAVCGARGTGWSSETDGNVTNVAAFENRVFVRGINKDGSVMEEEYWVNEGFERDITKFERPGEEKRIPASRSSEMRKEIGLGKYDKKGMEEELKGIEDDEDMREEQIERMQDRKEDELLDDVLGTQTEQTGGSTNDGRYVTKD